VYPGAVGFDSKTLLRNLLTVGCELRVHSSTRKSNAWYKVGETKSIFRPPQNVIHFVM